MAHSPLAQPDPFDRQDSISPADLPQPNRESEAGPPPAQSLRAITMHGPVALPLALALDLVLNEIAQQACTATAATAAAIALSQDGEIVCRATTGENAPGLGVRLDTGSGLSATCVKTIQRQHCADTETDLRVDRDLCRRLGVRSILVVPLLRDSELVGLVEIFSIHPHAFGDDAILSLERLSRTIVESLDVAIGPATQPEIASEPATTIPSPNAPEVLTAQPERLQETTSRGVQEADRWTGALLVAVVALALLLGWMVGRGRRQRRPTDTGASPPQGQVASPTASGSAQSVASPEGTATGPKSSGAGTSSGLVVYRGGKVVFRMPSPSSDAAPKNAATSDPIPSSEVSSAGSHPPVRISSQIAAEYLAQRVEPEYPEQAREQYIQGPVILDLEVAGDGVVQTVQAVSGNPQLVAAATNAVQQWRFRPFFHNGQPAAFRTRITVMFRLP